MGAVIRWIGRWRAALVAVVGVLLVAVATATEEVRAQQIPQPMSPARLVNDYAHLFSEWDTQVLEDSLRAFDALTSTQIAVVTVPDIGEFTPAEFATRILEEWGVGTREHDNGVVMLVKPRNQYGPGEIFIAVGYGLEGALPDILAGRIIDEEMLPYLGVREDGTAAGQPSYYRAVAAGAAAIRAAVRGEYTPPVKSAAPADKADQQQDDEEEETGGGFAQTLSRLLTVGLVVWIVLFLARIYRKGGGGNDDNSGASNNGGRGRSKLSRLGPLIGMFGRTLGQSRGAGGRGFGGGLGGGFGGGFGGFGGGQTGGGGAGRRF